MDYGILLNFMAYTCLMNIDILIIKSMFTCGSMCELKFSLYNYFDIYNDSQINVHL